MTTAQIKLPRKLVPVFAPVRGQLRYRAAYGGRGSGKSFNFAKMAAVFGYAEKLRILCTREFQVSIKESFHAELKNAIASEPWLAAAYDVGIDYIRGHNGTEFIFRGLRHNMGSIKSMAQIDICIIEEAEDVPEASWIDLEPTIRAPGSELWVIWNPRTDNSPVDKRFIKTAPPRSCIVEMNYWDNPFFPPELEELRRQQHRTFDDATYAHIWEGKYLTRTDAQIFAGKYRVAEFEPHEKLWDGPYFGLDFGFSQDPTAAVKAWIHDRKLYIEHEAGRTGLELDDTAGYLIKRVPDIAASVIRCDNARPESISFIKRNGLPRARPCVKGKGSVEDGIAFIKSFDEVVIHPRCKQTISEFRLYSYKVDRLSGDVLDAIVDSNNHYIDALRYALEPVMKSNSINYGKLL
jgi:phage terminase large subunit